ncbi:hypothetical protein BJ912DRAFT_410006 [Pholiota molesta]|nr:hypothetical protein BJ912DRAFT_410006 [Pholiota molesta]
MWQNQGRTIKAYACTAIFGPAIVLLVQVQVGLFTLQRSSPQAGLWLGRTLSMRILARRTPGLRGLSVCGDLYRPCILHRMMPCYFEAWVGCSSSMDALWDGNLVTYRHSLMLNAILVFSSLLLMFFALALLLSVLLRL